MSGNMLQWPIKEVFVLGNVNHISAVEWGSFESPITSWVVFLLSYGSDLVVGLK